MNPYSPSLRIYVAEIPIRKERVLISENDQRPAEILEYSNLRSMDLKLSTQSLSILRISMTKFTQRDLVLVKFSLILITS